MSTIPKNEHRHMSHLWGVYPGSEITPYGTPDLFKAARQSLIFSGRRGDRVVDGMEVESVGLDFWMATTPIGFCKIW